MMIRTLTLCRCTACQTACASNFGTNTRCHREQGRQRAPLSAAVDQRRGGEPDHPGRPGRAAPDLLPLLGQPLAGVEVDPAAQHAPEVLVPPHHALGVSGGAAGVEHVDVVGAALAEVTVGAQARDHGVEVGRARRQRQFAAVVDHQHDAQVRVVRQHRGDLVGVLPVVHQALELGLVEQVTEFGLDVAVIDVHRNGPQFVAGQEAGDQFDRVPAVHADVVTGPDAAGREAVRGPVAHLFELGVADGFVAAGNREAFRHRVDCMLE